MVRAKQSSSQKTSLIINVATGSLGGFGIGVVSSNLAYAVSAGFIGASVGLAKHYILELAGYKLTKVK